MPEAMIIDKLSVSLPAASGTVEAVQKLSLTLYRGELLAVVGESGCGKTTLCRAIMKLLPKDAQVRGSIIVEGTDLTLCTEKQMSKLRGRLFALIPQQPKTALDPTMAIGAQIAEAALVQEPKLPKDVLYRRVMELMELAGIKRPHEFYGLYPCHLSGGMCQRSVIAMALAGNPGILLADEPATALDVNIQEQLLDRLRELRRTRNMAVLFVTHDLAAARRADRIAIMYAGKIVELGTAEEVFRAPRHPYTRGLLRFLPPLAEKRRAFPRAAALTIPQEGGPQAERILEVQQLTHEFRPSPQRVIPALTEVTFSIKKGEIFGLVGESGSGKSTLARCIMNIFPPTGGRIFYDGIPLAGQIRDKAKKKRLARERQMIFQDAAASLNPRMRVADILAEPLVIHSLKPREGSLRGEAASLLYAVGMDEAFLDKYPWELSGGQLQRVAIARAFAARPRLLIADEPTASLDVSVRARIINLFRHWRKEGLSFLFISHDLSLVEYLCDRIGVMRQGRLEEA